MTLSGRVEPNTEMTHTGPSYAAGDQGQPDFEGAHRGQESSCDPRFDRIIDRLPRRIRSTIRWLRQPKAFAIRISAGVLLVCFGVLGFLPILGFWMLPLGLMLLAEDVPPLRSLRSRILNWIERRYPHWLAEPSAGKDETRRADGLG